MQYIFKQTVICCEWMPDGPLKGVIDRYAEVHEHIENDRFSLSSVLEHFNDVRNQRAVSLLESFMEANNLDEMAIVEWSW